MDLGKLSVAELNTLQREIARELNRRRKTEADSLISEFRKRASDLGLSLDQLVGGRAPAGSKRGKVPPKYRHPQDASLTWTGRGKRPRWVEEWVRGGKSLDGITI